MDEELNKLTIYAIQCAVIGLFCTLIAYIANWVDTHSKNMEGLRHYMTSHIHFNPHPHTLKIKRKSH